MKKLILCLALTVLFAATMATMAVYGITGVVSAYGASATAARAAAVSDETSMETASAPVAEEVTQETTTEVTTTEVTRTESGTVVEETNTTNVTSVSKEEEELKKMMSTTGGALTVHAVRLIICAIIVGIVCVIFWLLSRFFKRYKNPTDPNLKSKSTVMLILYSVLRFFIALVAILIILSLFGVNISGAIAGLGIAGAAGALAVQDLLKDVIMGVTLVSDKYFMLGDIVEYNGFLGKILEVSMRTTKIESLRDKSVMSVRNSNITEIKKLVHHLNISVPLPYEIPVKRAYEVLGMITEKCRELEPVEDAIAKGPNNFEDSYIDYLIVIVCDPANQLNTKRAVHTVIMQVLESENISIPFPQRDVHIIS